MIDESIGIPDASVRRVESLPETLEGARRVGPYSLAKPGMLLRVVPGVGRFLARDGKALEYCTEEGADEAAVEALLHGGVLGALMHQRGELPLHATTLVSPDRSTAIAVAGDSGAGKSTTSYELIRRGWTMLSDDLTRVTLERGKPIAWPRRSRIRLLDDACDRFGLDVETLAPAPNWPDKYMLEVEQWRERVALTAFVALARTDGPFTIERVPGVAAIRTLAEQTFRLHYVAALGCTERHLQLVAATAAGTAVFRTRGRASVADVGSAVESVVAHER
jgi:hypothetical protein